jgi:AcrR family transcriptional regulator
VAMSVAKWREREKEMRRNDIIEAAEKLFFSKGYDNVSMKDIAGEVELSKATLYLYFENKEELFFAIVLRGTQILHKTIEEEVEKEKNGINKIEAFKNAYIKFINDYSNYFKAYNYLQSGRFDLTDILSSDYIKEMMEKGRISSVLPSALPSSAVSISEYLTDIFNLRKDIFFILRDSIKMGVDEGKIRSDIDPLELSVILVLIYENMNNLRPDIKIILESQNIDLNEFVEDVKSILSNLMVTDNNFRL